jgi:hypothetical protein
LVRAEVFNTEIDAGNGQAIDLPSLTIEYHDGQSCTETFLIAPTHTSGRTVKLPRPGVHPVEIALCPRRGLPRGALLTLLLPIILVACGGNRVTGPIPLSSAGAVAHAVRLLETSRSHSFQLGYVASRALSGSKGQLVPVEYVREQGYATFRPPYLAPATIQRCYGFSLHKLFLPWCAREGIETVDELTERALDPFSPRFAKCFAG